MDGQRKKHNIRKKNYVSGVAVIILMNIAAWLSVDFCDWYIAYVYPVWLNTYARLTSLVPFSVGEIMLFLATLLTALGIMLCVWNVIAFGKYKRVLVQYGRIYAWIVLIVSYVMTCNCFIMYHASSFSEKYMCSNEIGSMVVGVKTSAVTEVMTEKKPIYTKKNIVILRNYLVEKCNTLALQIERDEKGNAIYCGDLMTESIKAMEHLGEKYEQLSGFYVTPKYLAASGFFSQQHIQGYYFPFSMEANINGMMHICNVAPTICHELSHTKGFIYEDDANFIAFLACIESEDLFVQYCGYLSVLNYVNNDFYKSISNNKNIYKRHVRISDLVAEDNIFLSKEDWEVVEKKAVVKTATVKKVSNTLMETTLKLNGVEEGMQQYDKVVNLLLDYYDGVLY